MVDIPSLIAEITLGSINYKMFYFPRASEICIEKSQTASVTVNIDYGSYDLFSFSQTYAAINSNVVQFDSSTPTCPKSANLVATTFSEPVAEIKLPTTTATALSSQLIGMLSLADQSCMSKVGLDCTQCINGYRLANDPVVCQIIPFGCLKADSSGMCINCRRGFDYDATSSRCFSGTKALVSSNSLSGNPKITTLPALSDWTIQFYLMVLPSSKSQNTVSYTLMEANQVTNSIVVKLDYSYNLAIPKNDLQIYIHQISGLQSGSISINKGQWILVSFYKSSNAYNLLVNKHGTTSIGSTSNLNLIDTLLKLSSSDFIFYLKQLIIWNSSFNSNPIGSHICRFTHPNTFLPHSLYTFNIDTIQSTTLLQDAMGNALTLDSSFLPSGSTYSDFIYLYQPISNLEENFFSDPYGGQPTCVECSPNCSSCSDLYTCTQCTTGILDNGICHSNAVNLLTGNAVTTYFVYQSIYKLINTHINVQLFQNPSLSYIQVSSYYIEYPDDTTYQISNRANFTIPKYKNTAVTQFNALLKVSYSLGLKPYTTQLATIQVNQIYSKAESIKDALEDSKLPVSEANECGCSAQSTCSTVFWTCVCQTGYTGTRCQYTESTLQFYQNQVTQEVATIVANSASLNSIIILTDMEYLSRQSQALTSETASAILNLVTSMLNSSSSQTQIDLSLEVLSHISQAASRSTDIGLTSGTQTGVKKILNILLPTTTNKVLPSSKITLEIQQYDQSTYNTVALSSTSNSTATLPPGLAQIGDQVKLVTIIYSEPIFEALSPHSFISGTQVITLELYVNGVQKQIAGLNDPVKINFKLDTSDKRVQECVSGILNGTQSLDDVRCSYYDPTLRIASTQGCTLVNLLQTEIQCACNHMTDFMSFVRPALSILQDSNYDVFLALGQLNISNLRKNLGFHFSVGYILLFCFLLILVSLLDCRSFKTKFQEQLYLAVHQLKENENKMNQNSLSRTIPLQGHNLSYASGSTSVAIYPLRQSIKEKSKTKEANLNYYKEENLSSCLSDGITFTPADSKPQIKMNSFFEQKEGSKRKKSKFISEDSEIEGTPTKGKPSAIENIKNRLNKIISEERNS